MKTKIFFVIFFIVLTVSCKKEKIQKTEDKIFGNYSVIAYFDGDVNKTTLYESECGCKFVFYSTQFQDYYDMALNCPQFFDNNNYWLLVGLWKMKDANNVSLTLGFDTIPGQEENMGMFPFNIYNVETAIEENNIKINDFIIKEINESEFWIERTANGIRYELRLKKD